MLNHLSIRTKLILILLLSIGILTAHMVIGQFYTYQTQLTEEKHRISQQLNIAFQTALSEQLQTYSLALESLLTNSQIINWFAEHRRDQLQQHLQDYFKHLSQTYGVAQFQFHLPPATSFLRLHKVEQFGDDLSAFRHTVVQTNQTRQPVRGLEVGRGDLGSRVVYPVLKDQQLLGSVEFGGSALHLVDSLKQVFGIEYAVGIQQAVFNQARRFATQDSDIIVGDTVFYSFSSALAQTLLTQYQPAQEEYSLHGHLYVTHRIPLSDYSGQEIGYILAISDLQAIAAQSWHELVNRLSVNLLVTLTIFVFLSLFLSHAIAKPLAAATRLTQEISHGNLNVSVTIKNQDEIGSLLNAIQNILLAQIKSVIQESGTVLERLAHGDFSARIVGEFTGDFAAIKQATNTTASDLQALISETSQALALLASGEAMHVKISGKFAGDFGEIKTALHTTADKLARAVQENTRQNWLKSGQNQLGEQISGEQSLNQLAQAVINFLTPYLNAQVGALYLWQTNQEETPGVLKMIASHAYSWRESAVYEFALGEGIIGQAALERKAFSINKPPADYLTIRSGLGETSAKAILVAPFLYENSVKGVIEFASIEAFIVKFL